MPLMDVMTSPDTSPAAWAGSPGSTPETTRALAHGGRITRTHQREERERRRPAPQDRAAVLPWRSHGRGRDPHDGVATDLDGGARLAGLDLAATAMAELMGMAKPTWRRRTNRTLCPMPERCSCRSPVQGVHQRATRVPG